MKIIAYIKTWFERAMTEPDVNSRVVFLAHGMATAFGLVALTVAFIFAKSKEVYPYMVGALAGGAAAGGVQRWMTKKGGADDADAQK